MRYSFLKTIIFLFAVVFAVVFVDSYFFDRKLTHVGPLLIKRPTSYIFAKLENTNFLLRRLTNIRNLVSENNDLKKKNFTLLSQLADYEDIKTENDFLRNALKIAPRFRGGVIYANVFNAQLDPRGYDVLVTKGTKDGISDNDVVITEEGVLLGRVNRSSDSFSSLLIVTDPNFSIMAKVLESGIAGIAKGAMEKGLYLDLIVQSDSIKEGDVIVSSGIDFYPPALIIGTVSHVEANETDLFKKVKIKPAINDVKIGRVLIIKNNTQ